MSDKDKKEIIGRSGRWLIFAGFPVAVVAFLFVIIESGHALDHVVSETILPYVLFFTPVAAVVGGRVVYDYLPRRLAFPFGIGGWVIGLGLLFWFFLVWSRCP